MTVGIDYEALKIQLKVLENLVDSNDVTLRGIRVDYLEEDEVVNVTTTAMQMMGGLENLLDDMLRQLEKTGEVHYKI